MGALQTIMGILAGHSWWFVTTYLPNHAVPRLRHRNPFTVPLMWRALFNRGAPGTTAPSRTKVTSGVSVSRPLSANEAVRHRWGSGQRLGGE